MGDVSFDSSSLDSLIDDLAAAAVRLDAETAETMPKVAAIVAEGARTIVEAHSKSIKVETVPVPGFAVVIGKAPDSPLARLYEKGNVKGKSQSGREIYDTRRKTRKYTSRGLQSVSSFRHPVFKSASNPNAPWVEQQRWAFLRPAANRLRKEVVALMDKAWGDGLERVFRR